MKKELERYVFMVVGCIFYALSVPAFLVSNKIVAGGITGAATIVHFFTDWSIGVMVFLFNIPILIAGVRQMGWKFIVRCFITTTCLSLLMDLFSAFVPPITNEPLLAAMYGGIFQGIGIGFFIKYQVSSGGTELLGRLTHSVLHFGSIAGHVAVFDGLIVVIGAIVNRDPENILYALILIFTSAKMSDLVVYGFSQALFCFIVSDKGEEISSRLIQTSPRGVTMIEGTGMYTHLPHNVMMTCIKNNQLHALKQNVKEIDPDAFVIVCNSSEVYGKGFNQIDDKNR